MKIRVAGRVDQVDRDIIDGERYDGGLDRDAALPFERQEIGLGTAVINAADLVDDTGGIEQPLGQGCLTGVYMRQNPQVQRSHQASCPLHRWKLPSGWTWTLRAFRSPWSIGSVGSTAYGNPGRQPACSAAQRRPGANGSRYRAHFDSIGRRPSTMRRRLRAAASSADFAVRRRGGRFGLGVVSSRKLNQRNAGPAGYEGPCHQPFALATAPNAASHARSNGAAALAATTNTPS